MTIKDFLWDQGSRVLSDPRVTKWMQDERVAKVIVQAIQTRHVVQEQFDSNVERVAKSLGLVTKSDVRELRRTVRKLETELKNVRAETEAAKRESSV